MTELMPAPDNEIKYRRGFGHVHMLYVIGADQDGPVKIGQSADVAQRVMTLQIGNPMPLMVFGLRLILPKAIPAGNSFNTLKHAKEHASRLERYVHTELHGMKLRMMGEWFDITAEEALGVIEKSGDNIGSRVITTEWVSLAEARLDPEYGWMRDELLSKVVNAHAQAAKINEMGLTLMRQSAII